MSKIRLDSDDIKYITMFETLTGASITDCVQEDSVMGFLVKKGDMGLAIGKNGANIERVRKAMGKSIIVMESSENLEDFVKNVFRPVKIKKSRTQKTEQGNTLVIEIDKKDRKWVIGSEGNRIKIAKKLAKRHYGIDDINVKVN